jgi:ribosomal protein S18 acetylase RimI-like enzyme
LTIVPAQPGDLQRYIDLLEELADWLCSRGIEQWPRGRARAGRDYYAASIANGEAHLALVDGQFVGALRLLARDVIVWPDIDAGDALYVYNLSVRRAWSGQGLGRRMLEWAERRAVEAGRRYLRLDCVPSNTFLRQYYEDAGFSARGEIDAVYPGLPGVMPLRRYEKRLEQTWR